MCFDYSKLLGKIKEVYGTQEKFAKALNLGRVSLSCKLNNKSDFSQTEMQLSAKLLGFSENEIPSYFFSLKVQKSEQNKQEENNYGKTIKS